MEPANKPPVSDPHAGDPNATAIEFLPDADEIERQPLPAYARRTLHLLAVSLLLSLLWTLRKLQSGSSLLRKSTARLQALETLSVGTRQKIMLIRVDEREILLGVTAQQMTVLSPWPETTQAVPDSPETNTP